MGTFNYKKSNKIITLARKYYDPSDREIEEEKEILKNDFDLDLTFEETREKLINDDIEFVQAETYNNIKSDIESLNLEYYKIDCVSGYYEGFQLLIDFNFSWFETYQDRKQAQKELTRIKKFLIDVINNYCLYVCYPGWVDGWENEKESILKVNKAIKEERKELNKIETKKQYWKNYNKYYAR